MQPEEKRKIKLTPGVALVKIQSYCAYQERSHYEVREKLYSYGLYKDDVEQIMAQLVTENFLNEERFAEAYASGKFRIKYWGKNKIKLGLKNKKVSEYCIKKALKGIDEDEYYTVLTKVITKKFKTEKEKNQIRKNAKVAAYALSRGFEGDLVWEIIKSMSEK